MNRSRSIRSAGRGSGAIGFAAIALALGCESAPMAPDSAPVQNKLIVTVSMPDGRPAAGAYVQAQPAEPLPPAGGVAVVFGFTGPDGRVELSGMERVPQVVSTVPDEGDSLIAAAIVDVTARDTPVALRLVRGATLTGGITIRGRSEHDGAVVNIRGVVGRADTDKAGRYLLRPAPVGNWLVVFGLVGQHVTIDSLPVTIASGDSLELPPVEIVPTGP